MKLAVPLALLLVCAACAGPEEAPRPDAPPWTAASYPGVLRDPASLPFDVVWRQTVTATWGEDGRRSFDAAVQKRGDVLTVLGLSPLGVGFVLTLEGDAVAFENRTDQALPFPPRFVVLDVQRVFFPWLPAGARDGAVDGERVVERWEAGRLVERRFSRQDGDPGGEIVVTYDGYEDGRTAPRRATLSNGWFGYALEVETQEETKLVGP